ncbi:hypothetical protein DPEC_G00065320 [Dallia pectoralis]|uniref:Uncharacterized protein n=1 Tax=Dallia pectoralis TaxID=75939 RepID=A0ACC2H8S7_DALPE|nr:hypothetical protein DPEC_G00065320 [Dallia pectoralis]
MLVKRFEGAKREVPGVPYMAVFPMSYCHILEGGWEPENGGGDGAPLTRPGHIDPHHQPGPLMEVLGVLMPHAASRRTSPHTPGQTRASSWALLIQTSRAPLPS